MAMSPEFARMAKVEEHDAIDALLRLAFGRAHEARLVRDLRATGVMEVEMVLPWEGEILAYLALSRLIAPAGSWVLAPVAVTPQWHGKRLGTRLVTGAMRLMAIRQTTVVVLGKPSFFDRCGFSCARVTGVRGPDDAAKLMIARSGHDVPDEALVYPAAFAGM